MCHVTGSTIETRYSSCLETLDVERRGADSLPFLFTNSTFAKLGEHTQTDLEVSHLAEDALL